MPPIGTEAHDVTFILQKTLSPSVPPRIPERPKPPNRYAIIPERKLVDLSDAPMPPPRSTVGASKPGSQFISNIVKDANGVSDFLTSTISFGDFEKDKAMLKLTMSTHQRKPLPLSLPPSETVPQTSPTASVSLAAVMRPGRSTRDIGNSAPRPLAMLPVSVNGKAREVTTVCTFILISIMCIFVKYLMNTS